MQKVVVGTIGPVQGHTLNVEVPALFISGDMQPSFTFAAGQQHHIGAGFLTPDIGQGAAFHSLTVDVLAQHLFGHAVTADQIGHRA